MSLGGQNERLGIFVVHNDVLLDGSSQFGDAAKHTAAQPETYGAMLDAAASQVDEAETKQLRQALRISTAAD